MLEKEFRNKCPINCKVVSLIVLAVAVMPRHANAWGKVGHETIAGTAAQIVRTQSKFWKANAAAMINLTTVPDRVWKIGASAVGEKPTHWFQMDSYFTNPGDFNLFPRDYSQAVLKYTEATLIVNGTATWRVQQFYDLAVAAFKRGDLALGLEMAGAMSHYVGDLSQPLHVSKNYDGGETGDVGIHKFFETTTIEGADLASMQDEVKSRATSLLTDSQLTACSKKSVVDGSFDEVTRALTGAKAIIATDLREGRGTAGETAQLKLAIPRMSDGAATLALLLERMTKESGLTEPAGSAVTIAIPAWVQPHYDSRAPRRFYMADVDDGANGFSGFDCDQ